MQQEQHEITEIAPDMFVDKTGHQLTQKEIRQIVTPHAFAVADELIGQPLARPMRRGLAMLIDGVIISGLASASLLFVLPAMLYLCWNRYKAKKTNQLLLMVIATLAMLATLSWAPELVKEQESSASAVAISDVASLATLLQATKQVAEPSCDVPCAEQALRQLAADLRQSELPAQQQHEMLQELAAQSRLEQAQQSALLAELQQTTATVSAEPAPASSSLLDKLDQSDYSVLKWIKGVLSDIGLGFGWAVAYFTFFTSWNHGQTIGKQLTRIRVLQLDNKPLTLWASFSRQGGYGAGFATGLIGFAQIFWDPNRQAIQDKVAGTVVVRLT